MPSCSQSPWDSGLQRVTAVRSSRTGAPQSSAKATLSVAVLLFLGAVLVLGSVVHGMLANVAAILSQVFKLFGVLLLMFLVALVLLASALTHPSTQAPQPAPTTVTTAPIKAAAASGSQAGGCTTTRRHTGPLSKPARS